MVPLMQVYETIIDHTKRRLDSDCQELSTVHHIMAGASAGACATVVE